MNNHTMSNYWDDNYTNEKHFLKDLTITLTRCDEPLCKLNLSSKFKQNCIQEFSESSSPKKNLEKSVSEVEIETSSLETVNGEKISSIDNFFFPTNSCNKELAFDESSNQSETTVSCSSRTMYDIEYLSDDNTCVVGSSQVLSLNSEGGEIFPKQNYTVISSHEKLQKGKINSMDIISVNHPNDKDPSKQHTIFTDKILSQLTLIKKKGRPRKENSELKRQNTYMVNEVNKTYEEISLMEKNDHSRKERLPTALAYNEVDGCSGHETHIQFVHSAENEKKITQENSQKRKRGHPSKKSGNSFERQCQNTDTTNDLNNPPQEVSKRRKSGRPKNRHYNSFEQKYQNTETPNDLNNPSQETSKKRKAGRPRKENGNIFNEECQNMDTTNDLNNTLQVVSQKRKPGRPRKESDNSLKHQCNIDTTANVNNLSNEILKKRKAGRPRKESDNSFEQRQNAYATDDIKITSQEAPQKRKVVHPWKKIGNSFGQPHQNMHKTNDLNNPSQEISKKRKADCPMKEIDNSFENSIPNMDTTTDFNNPPQEISKKRKAGRPKKEIFLIEIISDSDECSENEINTDLKRRVENKSTQKLVGNTFKKKVGRPRKDNKPDCLGNNDVEVPAQDLRIKENNDWPGMKSNAHCQIATQSLNPEVKKTSAEIRLKKSALNIGNGRRSTRSSTLSNLHTSDEKRFVEPVNKIKLGFSEKTALKFTSSNQHKSLFKPRHSKKKRSKRFTWKKNRKSILSQPLMYPYIEIDRDEVTDSFGMIPIPLDPSSMNGNSNFSNHTPLVTTGATGHSSFSNTGIRPPLTTTGVAGQSSFSNLMPLTSTDVTPFPVSLIYNKSVTENACHSAHSCCKKCAVKKINRSTQWEDPAEIFEVIANLTAQKQIPLKRRFILTTAGNVNSEKSTNPVLPKTNLVNNSAAQNIHLITNTVGHVNSSETSTNPEVPKIILPVMKNSTSQIVLANTVDQVNSSEQNFNPIFPKTSLQNNSATQNVLLANKVPINNLLTSKDNSYHADQSSLITFPLILHKITPVSSQATPACNISPLYAQLNHIGASNISHTASESTVNYLYTQQSPNFSQQDQFISKQNPNVIQQDLLLNKPSFSLVLNHPLKNNLTIKQSQKILSSHLSKNKTTAKSSLTKLNPPSLLRKNLKPSLISSKYPAIQQHLEDHPTVQTSKLNTPLNSSLHTTEHQQILQPPQLVPVHEEDHPTVEASQLFTSSDLGKCPTLQTQILQPPHLVPVHLDPPNVEISQLLPSLESSRHTTEQQQILSPPQSEDQLTLETSLWHPSLDPLEPSKHTTDQQIILEPSLLLDHPTTQLSPSLDHSLSTTEQQILQPPQLVPVHLEDQPTVEISLVHPLLDHSKYTTTEQQILQSSQLQLDQPIVERSQLLLSRESSSHTTEQQHILPTPQLNLEDQLTLETSLWYSCLDSLEPSKLTTEQQIILQPSQSLDHPAAETSQLCPSLDPSLSTIEPILHPQVVPVQLEDQPSEETPVSIFGF